MIFGVATSGCGNVSTATLKVLAANVRGPRFVVVAECFDEHELFGVVQAARPLEPHAAGLGPGGSGERSDQFGESVDPVGLHLHLGDMKITVPPRVNSPSVRSSRTLRAAP